MEKRYILSQDAVVFSMCGAFTSIRPEESQLGSRSECPAFGGPGLMIPRWIPPVELSINENKLVMNMAEVSGGIWVLDNVDR